MSNMHETRNLSQSTYDRIQRKLELQGLSNQRPSWQDLRDLMEAYEGAAERLDNLLAVAHQAAGSAEAVAAAEYLYTESGEPRVILRDDD